MPTQLASTAGTIVRVPTERTQPHRRAERLRPGPLRVEMESGAHGTLVDLSELGALLDLPTSGNIGSHVAFDLHWEGTPVRLQGRVVRSTPIEEGDRVAWAEPTSYHVAIEFDLEARDTLRLQDVLRRARQGMR